MQVHTLVILICFMCNHTSLPLDTGIKHVSHVMSPVIIRGSLFSLCRVAKNQQTVWRACHVLFIT